MAHVECGAVSKSNAMVALVVEQPGPMRHAELSGGGAVAHPPRTIVTPARQARGLERPNRLEFLPDFERELPAARAVQIAEEAVGFIGQGRILVEQVVDGNTQPGRVEWRVVVDRIGD